MYTNRMVAISLFRDTCIAHNRENMFKYKGYVHESNGGHIFI